MKKFIAIIMAVTLLFSMSVTVFARNWIISPIAPPSNEEAEDDESPKTGDMNLVMVGLAGGAMAVTSVVAAVKSRKEA